MTSNQDFIGKFFGQFELQEILHDGNINVIYRGYQASLNRSVVVQTLAVSERDDDSFRRAITQAANIIAEYEHPNIVPILDYGMYNDVPYIVMQHMKGGTLENRLKNGVFQLQEVASAIQQIGSALDYVHALEQVHGDPARTNIVFDSWGNAYISDFLTAGFMSETELSFMGVPYYIAPERWESEEATAATDQFALGVIAYEMLTGVPPFMAKGVGKIMNKIMNEQPTLPQELRSEIPTAVNEVLFQALAKDPLSRFATVNGFVKAFTKSIQSIPTHLFISYSRRDIDYAKRLQSNLQEAGFTVWIDDRIEHGDQWFDQINEALKTCAAFLVIMTPDSEQSEWVHKEILLAKRYNKAIFPLLLNGEEFPILIDIQFADVRDGSTPKTPFHRRLNRTVYGTL